MRKRWLCGLIALAMVLAMVPGAGTVAEATETSDAMTVSDEFIEVLKTMEGFYTYAEWDYKQYTVGYGTKCPDDKLAYYLKNPITEEEAVALLHQELASFETTVNTFAAKYGLTFTQNEFDALVSFSYNCGGSWTGDTAGYLNTAVRTGDRGNGLIYGLCLWSSAGGDYNLIRRRLCEANMYINGVYKAYNEEDPQIPDTYKYVFLDGNGGWLRYVINGYDAAEPVAPVATFSSIPTGTNENGDLFVYTFGGWYTAKTGGTKVEKLDGSLANGTILYARWLDPDGREVQIPQEDTEEGVEVSVTTKASVYNGPGSYYTAVSTAKVGTKLTITKVIKVGSYKWGQFDGGWISLKYTDYNSVIANLPPAEEEMNPIWGTVNADGVNYRSVPTIRDNESLGKMNKGDRVLISETTTCSDGMTWGKMEDGNWICMTYVTLDGDSLTVLTLPDKTEYVQMQDTLDLAGSVLLATYADGTATALTIPRDNTTGFSNAALGTNTLTVTYDGMTVTLDVTIIKATVTFLNYDGTVLSSAQYAYGDAVKVPAAPVKTDDSGAVYRFVGWNKTVTACSGDATYTAVFEIDDSGCITGDFDGSRAVNEDDAIYLLRHVLLPEKYPVVQDGDVNGDGKLNEDDAIYLLRHVLLPDKYPLS